MGNNNVKILLTATNLGKLSWSKMKSFTKIPTINACFILLRVQILLVPFQIIGL